MADTPKKQEIDIIYEEKHRGFRGVELNVWILIAVAIIAAAVVNKLTRDVPEETIRYNLLLGFFVLVFPIIFQLVFGQYPLEMLRNRYGKTYYEDRKRLSLGATRKEIAESLTAEGLLLDLAESSKRLADGIYGRSGVYLLVGVMVAFSGLAFFYVQTSGSFTTENITALMVSLAPKFGILFFIEFVAFFFLKQYRTSMDEFRYYEAIKRRREEMLVLVKMGIEQSKPVDSFELVKLGQFFSVAGRLEKEETTELLEARKLEKNETAVLEKAIDAIAQARK